MFHFVQILLATIFHLPSRTSSIEFQFILNYNHGRAFKSTAVSEALIIIITTQQ